MLKRLSIRSKLGLIAVLPIVAMLSLTLLAWRTLSAVRVGSAAERKVVDSHSVVEDVLPPPLFVVEPFLVISLASEPENAPNLNALLLRYANLKRDYQVNHDKWVPKDLPPALRQALLVDSYNSAQQFFDIVDTEILPHIHAEDDQAARIIADRLEPVFETHRNQILTVIKNAREYEAAQRASVSGSIDDRTALFLAGLVIAIGMTLLLSLVIGRTIRESIRRLRRAAEEDLPRVMAELRDADDETLANARLEPVDLGTQDELSEAADAFNAVLDTAVGLAAQQTVQRRHTSEMFVNLGRRNQNLVARQLKFIDSLERTESDGDRLSELFRLDNLATRMRRNAESLLVLAGVEPPRRWRKPVRLFDVVRGAMAEIEEFRRIEVGSFDDVLVQGASVANITHLLAELLENAARFSPPDTNVTVNGVDTGTGYLLGIHDRGLGMPADQLASANERLGTVRRLEEVPTAYLGLYVVARLAARDGIVVELESPDGDGLTAWVRLPVDLLAVPEPDPAAGADADGLERPSVRRLEIAARAAGLAEAGSTVAPSPGSSSPSPSSLAGLPARRRPTAAAEARPAPARTAAPGRAPGGPPAATPVAAAPVAAPPVPAPTPKAPPAPPSVELQAPPVGRSPGVPADGGPAEAGLPRPTGAPLPPPATPTTVAADDVASSLGQEPVAEAGATRSGFRKRTRAAATVEFDRFADRPVPTGNRSAEDIKDRLDRFSAGKRFASTRTNDADPHAEDDE